MSSAQEKVQAMLGGVLPIILVVVFWILLAAFTVFFVAAALRAPTEGEIEAQNADSDHSHAH
jgi:hypothetical protein